MIEQDILSVIDYIDELADTDPNYGLDLFFKIKGKEKEKCLDIISKIEEIDIKMPTETRSNKGKLSYEKGLLLEQLSMIILSTKNIFSKEERVICDSNEIDILLQPATNNGIYSRLLPYYLKNDCLVECKNHKKKIDVTLLGKFYSLMRYKKSKFGIMVTNKPFTGESEWKDAMGLAKKLFLRDNTMIINITIEMIKEMIYEDINIIKLLKKEVDKITYHTEFSKHIVEHPAEEKMLRVQ